jgi:hypothetical protein
MKKVLIFAAVAEAATGIALLAAPSLVGHLLFGQEFTGVTIPAARVTGIALIALAIACWPGPALVGMLVRRGRDVVSCLRRSRRRFHRSFSLACRCTARSSVNFSRSRLAYKRCDETVVRAKAECPLLGVKRTSLPHRKMSANDPKQTLPSVSGRPLRADPPLSVCYFEPIRCLS